MSGASRHAEITEKIAALRGKKNYVLLGTSSHYNVVFFPKSEKWTYRGRVFEGGVDALTTWLNNR